MEGPTKKMFDEICKQVMPGSIVDLVTVGMPQESEEEKKEHMTNEQKLLHWSRELSRCIKMRAQEIPKDLEMLTVEKDMVIKSMAQMEKFKDL